MSYVDIEQQRRTRVVPGNPSTSVGERSAKLPALALAVLALSTVLIAFLPVAGKQVTYSWRPPSSFSLGQTPLMMPATPLGLEMTIPCAAVRAYAPAADQGARRIFTTGYSTEGELSVWVSAETINVLLGVRPVLGASIPTPSDDACSVSVRYDDATRTLSVAAGDRVQRVPLKTSIVRTEGAVDQIQITGLGTDLALRTDISATVVARPSTQQWPLLRWAIASAGLLAALFIWWGYYRRSVPWTDPRPTPRWSASDTVVTVAAGVALFITPPLSDDGWVLTTVRAFPQLGFFSNYFTADMAAQPEGFWWTSIERIWMTPLGTSILALRIPALVIGVLTWWYLRRRVLDQVVPEADLRLVRAVGAAIFIVGMWAWTPTLRPEPLVALLAVIAVALVLRFRRRRDPWVLSALALVAALAFSVHQTGWIVVGVAFACLPDLRDWWRSEPASARNCFIAAAGQFVGLVLILMMLKSNLAILQQAGDSFVEGGKHSAIFNEALRVRMLAASTAPPVRVLSALLVALGPLDWLLLNRGPERDPVRLVMGASALGGLFLAFTGSKWMWHFGATVGLAAVLVPLVVARSARTRRGARLMVVAAVLIGFLVTARGSAWGLNDLRTVDGDVPVLSVAARVLVFGAIAVIAAYLLRGHRPRRAMVTAIVASVAVVSATSVFPVVLDGVRDPVLSWPALVAHSAMGECGLASAMTVPTITAPLSKAPGATASSGTLEADWGTDLRIPQPPIPQATTLASQTGLPAALESGWYAVDSGHAMRTWLFSLPGSLSYSLDWQMPDGTTVSQDYVRRVIAASWVLVGLQAPEGARQVRFRWLSGQAPYALAPVAVRASAPVTTLAVGTVLRTPYNALLAPCFPQPDISTGAMSPFGWSLGLPMLGQSKVVTGVQTYSEQACVPNPQSGPDTAPLCWYSVSSPSSEGLRRTSVLVDR